MKDILVSVVVITYNSSKFVLETLNSILEQDYQNIEVIISDDCSKDNTVALCSKWLKENSCRFVRTKLLIRGINTGTTANCNRGVKEAHGEWIKIIAGDDKFLPNSISSYVNFILNNKNVDFVFAKVLPFGNIESRHFCDFFKDTNKYFERLSTLEFRILLCKKDFLPASSAFLKSKTLAKLGYFDEAIPFIEDWPLWVKGVFNNCIYGWIDKGLVGYRYSDSSVSQNLNPIFVESKRKAEKHNLLFVKKISLIFWLREYINFKAKYTRRKLWKILRILRYFNPYTYFLLYISFKIKK